MPQKVLTISRKVEECAALWGGGGSRAMDPAGCAGVGWRRMALFSLFIAPDAKNILQPAASFRGLAGNFVVRCLPTRVHVNLCQLCRVSGTTKCITLRTISIDVYPSAIALQVKVVLLTNHSWVHRC